MIPTCLGKKAMLLLLLFHDSYLSRRACAQCIPFPLQFLLIELEHVDWVDDFRLALGIFGYFGGELIDQGPYDDVIFH